jgi:hypothetical protein
METAQRPSPASVCLAGEYFVAAELARMGHIALITLRNTDKVDILASNAEGTRTVSLQVKTQSGRGTRWPLHHKAEKLQSPSLFYVFVTLKTTGTNPDYYIVPSRTVAKEVRENHKRWLATPGRKGQAHRDNSMRLFTKAQRYKDRWDLLRL